MYNEEDVVESTVVMESVARVLADHVREHMASSSRTGRHGGPAPYTVHMMKQMVDGMLRGEFKGDAASHEVLVACIRRHESL